ncbi:hypothetical protein Poly30_03600 [Planctomycetes bacterium Poly30]|uniref:Uncharacterized protein n=1 Tax=Saltatorellus ferox TaxID=2528018 RepID=A0A518EL98_9BACT|nr:hypothetical protein Poly30_03600 [Planctomycetes bacterium Poly30]
MKLQPWFIAIAVVYAPLVAPFFMGPLTECDHCVGAYARHVPLVPAFWVDHTASSLFGYGAMPRFDTVPGIALRGLVCLGMVGFVRWLLTRRPFVARLGSAIVATLVGVFAVGFTVLLRM